MPASQTPAAKTLHLGSAGEVLGWWNEVGEVLTTVGTLGCLLVAWTALATGSTEEQVDRSIRSSSTTAPSSTSWMSWTPIDGIQLELDR